jgi:hypothetical protein
MNEGSTSRGSGKRKPKIEMSEAIEPELLKKRKSDNQSSSDSGEDEEKPHIDLEDKEPADDCVDLETDEQQPPTNVAPTSPTDSQKVE